ACGRPGVSPRGFRPARARRPPQRRGGGSTRSSCRAFLAILLAVYLNWRSSSRSQVPPPTCLAPDCALSPLRRQPLFAACATRTALTAGSRRCPGLGGSGTGHDAGAERSTSQERRRHGKRGSTLDSTPPESTRGRASRSPRRANRLARQTVGGSSEPAL